NGSDVANLFGEAFDETLFRCRLGFCSGVGEHLIEGVADFQSLRLISNLHDIPAHISLQILVSVFIEVVVTKKELRLVDARFPVINAGDVELPWFLWLPEW